MLIAIDCETTGVDLAFGARPFLVTVCREDGQQMVWEWDVDPATRQVQYAPSDLAEIREAINAATEIAGQNLRFDAKMLVAAGVLDEWPWAKCQDTLVAGHLLASNLPHDLTSMVLHYLGEDIKPLEDALREAVQSARRLVASKKFERENSSTEVDLFEEAPATAWRTAREGDPLMPSAGSDAWHADYWLPRAVAKHLRYPDGSCEVVNVRESACDLLIDRTTQWGNPYRINGSYTRERSIELYREWVVGQPNLLRSLGTLAGKRLGCHCKPLPCHGDVIAELVRERVAHPWYSVCSRYANGDSAYTLLLWKRMRRELEQRNLWAIYRDQMRLPEVIACMETTGVTYDLAEGKRLRDQYKAESDGYAARCVEIAASMGFALTLPKGATNKSLQTFCFGEGDGPDRKPYLDLPPVSLGEKSGAPSLNKASFDTWELTLPDGQQLEFVQALQAKRKRDTFVTYSDSYARFAVPMSVGWGVLHPSLNQTGTAHLRMSSNNPNGQNAGKQVVQCKRCKGKGEINGEQCGECHGEGEVNFNLRRGFRPASGREFWALDYENIELMIPAYEAEEQLMIELFEKPNDPPFYGSQHLLNASIVYPDLFWPLADKKGEFKRQYASTYYQWIKNFDFAISYQCGEATGDRSARKKGAYRLVKQKFANLSRLSDSYVAFAKRHGYVETLPDKTVDPVRGYPIMCQRGPWGDVSPTIPFNYHVSGSASWAMRKAMVRVYEYLRKLNREDDRGYKMSLQIHDELLFDFPAGGKRNLARIMKVKELMEESGADIGIPLRVAVSWHPHNWAESKPLEEKK